MKTETLKMYCSVNSISDIQTKVKEFRRYRCGCAGQETSSLSFFQSGSRRMAEYTSMQQELH